MMDCVLSGSLLVVFSLFCYVMCVFFEQINSLSLSLSGLCVGHTGVLCTNRLTDRKDAASRVNRPLVVAWCTNRAETKWPNAFLSCVVF